MEELLLYLFTALFILLFPASMLWLLCCHRLFRYLQRTHPEKFRLMGSPDLLQNNTPQTSISLLRFILRREWRELDDPALSLRCRRMLLLFRLLCVLSVMMLALVIALIASDLS